MFTEEFTIKTGQNFETYYKKYRPKLVRFLIGIGKDEDDAEDVATEAFVTSLNKIESYDPTKAVFSTWLFTIAKRIMIQKAREKNRFTSIDYDYEEGFSLGDTLSYDDTNYESGHAINHQKSGIIKNLIPELPEKYATVLTLRHIENLSYHDIAEELGNFYIEIPLNDKKKVEFVKTKLAYLKFKHFYSTENDINYCATFSFNYDSLRKGFIVYNAPAAAVKKSHQQDAEGKEIGLIEFLKNYLTVDAEQHSLNLNTVKSRIRQARLLLYKITKNDFDKLDSQDDDKLNLIEIYKDMNTFFVA
jgi:RNA polymerase sigma-70 factor (ECF subfamily)